MSATTQAAHSLYNHIHNKPLPELISDLLHERGGKWKGTAQQLVEALHLKLAPRSLSTKLNKLKTELEKVNIDVTHKKIGGKKVLVLSFAGNHTAIATKTTIPTQSIKEEGVANYEGKITFPFIWQYGVITELSREEKERINRLMQIGRKSYHKICALCGGNGGNIKFRKESDGNSCLICRECAEKYCASALRVEEKMKKFRG